MTASVYFVQSGESNGPVKIGFSSDVGKRVEQLRTGNPLPISILGSFECQDPRSVEATLHRRFSLDRLEGEWFKCTPLLLEFVSFWKLSTLQISLTQTTVFNRLSKIVSDCDSYPVDVKDAWVIEWSAKQRRFLVNSLLDSTASAFASYVFGDDIDFRPLFVVESDHKAKLVGHELELWTRASDVAAAIDVFGFSDTLNQRTDR